MHATPRDGWSRRRFLRTLGIGTAGIAVGPTLLAACSDTGASGDGAAGDVPRVKLLDTASSTANGLFRPVVVDRHLDDEADLAVDWVGGEPSQAQTSLISGAMDVGAFGVVGAATAQSQGHPVRLFAPSLNCHVKWLTRGNAGLNDLGDLRGRRVGTLQETTGTYQATSMTAQLAGIDFADDLEVTTGAPSAIFALFERGDLDAIATTEPGATVLVADGAKEIADVDTLWQTHSGIDAHLPLVSYAAMADWLTENPEAHRATSELIGAVNGYLHEDPNRIRDFATEMGVAPDNQAAIDLLPERMGHVWSPQWDDATFAAFDRQLELAEQLGMIDTVPDTPLYLEAPR